MSEEVESLRAEVAALRSELALQRAEGERAISRRRLLRGLAGLGAAGAAGVAAAPRAAAANGDPIILGENNEASNETFIRVEGGDNPSEVALNAQQWGILAIAESVGVLGSVGLDGVAGIWGEHAGPAGSGVAGNATEPGGIGVIATSKSGPALAAQSEADGVTLELKPAARSGPPTSMPAGLLEYRAGAISVDQAGEVWLCTSEGAPGTWTRLLREDTAPGRTVPITPLRALDTRAAGGRPSGAPAVPGQTQGPIHGNQAVTLDLAGVASIPATAAGVIGSIAAVQPTYNGFLRAAPSGTTVITSAVNFTKGAIIANAFTSALGPAGLTITPSGGTSNTLHIVVDITAYIT